MISGHSQSLQLIGLGVNPTDVPTAIKAQLQEEGVHNSMGVATQVPSLDDRGGCATGCYRTPTTLGHSTKLGDIAALPNA